MQFSRVLLTDDLTFEVLSWDSFRFSGILSREQYSVRGRTLSTTLSEEEDLLVPVFVSRVPLVTVWSPHDHFFL